MDDPFNTSDLEPPRRLAPEDRQSIVAFAAFVLASAGLIAMIDLVFYGGGW